jgi:ubiquinone/menaquinone biosynthesis C-methylase UbiE
MNSLPLPEIQKQVATLQIAERFFDSATLFALFRLGVFRALANGPATLDNLHTRIGGDKESLRAVLDAGVALKILGANGGEYQANDLLLGCLGREESPSYIGPWVAFLHALATPLLKLSDAVLTEHAPASLYETEGGDNSLAKTMSPALDAYAKGRGIEIAERLDFPGNRTLLDLGCGPGTYAMAIVEKYPGVRATLLDLPGAVAQAQRLAANRGLSGRLEFIAADALTWVSDRSYDDVLISNTLHMLGPVLSLKLLKRAHTLVSAGGRIIIQAEFLNDDRTSPRWPTLLNLILRVATPQGRNHSLGETRSWLEQSGFTDIKHVRFSLTNVNSVLIGRKPS